MKKCEGAKIGPQGPVMAAANLSRLLLNSQVRCHGISRSRGRCNPLSLRAFNGDQSRSPEEQAKMGLKQLDDQLSETSSPSSPRSPLPGTDIEDLQMKLISKGSLPDLSDGFLLFLGGGLLLLTVVNNLLFYYFVERPNRDSQGTQQTEGQKLDSGKLSVDDNKAAPQPQASRDM